MIKSDISTFIGLSSNVSKSPGYVTSSEVTFMSLDLGTRQMVRYVSRFIRADREMRSVTIVSEPSCGLGDSPRSVNFCQWLFKGR